ncbi:hypothetical protein IWZ03DRAFT_42292 [Phyllosticta citriasiana]|uniref:Uncharacterized protein n=1 Tax=Phyllosticta citriasiana TaxID=595635 RepID=A0ABR1KEF4_9PEZI
MQLRSGQRRRRRRRQCSRSSTRPYLGQDPAVSVSLPPFLASALPFPSLPSFSACTVPIRTCVRAKNKPIYVNPPPPGQYDNNNDNTIIAHIRWQVSGISHHYCHDSKNMVREFITNSARTPPIDKDDHNQSSSQSVPQSKRNATIHPISPTSGTPERKCKQATQPTSQTGPAAPP